MDVSDQSEQYQVRLEKLKKYNKEGESSFKNGFTPKNFAQELHARFALQSKDELEALGVRAKVAGRILAIRDFGKASFLRLLDGTGNIQLYVQKNRIGDEAFRIFKDFDIGDLIYAEGLIFKTKTQELSIQLESVVLLTKALRPLPEKFHGLTDIELKYRLRYLDLIINPKVRETFKKRSKIIEIVRSFLEEKGFLEVETPMMHPIAGGATARPFLTHHNALNMPLFMRIAPELYLKRLLVGGLDRVFEINRCFRNEGISIKHNPEFTTVEFYQAYATYLDLMDLIELLFQQIYQKLEQKSGSVLELSYQGTVISLKGPWRRMRLEESILKLSGFQDPSLIRERAALLNYVKKTNLGGRASDSIGVLQMLIFDAEVEKQLIQPTFITHYPLDVSPLARRTEDDPFLVDRFELYIYGREMANAFSELNDPLDQSERFRIQSEQKKAGDPEACELDQDFVTALEYGMPPTAGAGIGIDRLVMLFTDSVSIRDVILFPIMRPQLKESARD